MKRVYATTSVWLLVLAALVFFTGCDEEVVAVTGTDRAYSLYGVFSPQLDTQWVRVFPIEGSLRLAGDSPLAATVTSDVGGRPDGRVWTDSVMIETSGQFAHVFWAPFSAEYERTYTLRVSGDDGRMSRATATVPPETEMILPARTNQPASVFSVRVQGAAPNLIRIEITYSVRYLGFGGIEIERFTVGYDDEAVQTSGGWDIPVSAGLDVGGRMRALAAEGLRRDVAEFKVSRIDVRLIVANAEWKPPGGSFDADVLVQPGLMSNVTNGFGFLGAGYRHQASWIPLDTLIVSGGG
ncbi:MAG: hypothetical protein JJ896_09940 [Rhodothermales bacterium]|nr:hypothetical protein [Rhodothermales bacterium]MBO6779961.1 hypothetical protein [Rhodothermales bacterium]